MLYRIVEPTNDSAFRNTFVPYIKAAYWPEQDYMSQAGSLPTGTPTMPLTQIVRDTKKALGDIVETVAGGDLYIVAADGTGARQAGRELPFMDSFHRLFLQRQYDYPYPDPRANAADIFRLNPPPAPGVSDNYSKNRGNYNHFVNVVMAAARLVAYFKDSSRIESWLSRASEPSAGGEAPSHSELCSQASALSYRHAPDMRSLKLMLAAFYHDIGKTVVDHRHGMEGAFILADHTMRSLYQMRSIAEAYSAGNPWEREDLLEISNFLYFHDSFGTLGTGESSYTALPEILDRIKRSSLRREEPRADQIALSDNLLFDLWVLNLADILASGVLPVTLPSGVLRMSKWEHQKVWETAADANRAIEEFLQSELGRDKIHDLGVARRLLREHNKSAHRDDTYQLREMAQEESRAHAVERIRRLIGTSLSGAWAQFCDADQPTADDPIYTRLFECVFRPYAGGQSPGPDIMLGQGVIHNIIFRAIQSLSDPEEFYERLSWIVCMDYSLGFFSMIARRAIDAIAAELRNTGRSTGWVYQGSGGAREFPTDYLCKMNATFFIDNYAATIVKILSHLLFRERFTKQLSNLEFEDARNRLTEDKIDKIIGLEGPHRQDRSIELILRTVFVY